MVCSKSIEVCPHHYTHLVPPQIVRPSPDQVAVATGTLTATCIVTGVHIPDIFWKKGDSVLANGSRLSISEAVSGLNQITSTLTVSGVMSEDSGTYTCNATNSEGSVTESFAVTVFRKFAHGMCVHMVFPE